MIEGGLFTLEQASRSTFDLEINAGFFSKQFFSKKLIKLK